MTSHTPASVRSRGLTLHLDIIESGQVSATGGTIPTIVFIPGTGCWSEMYNPFLDGLADRGFRVLGLDPQGHGRSRGKRGDFTINELLQNISDTISFTIEGFGERVGLMGSSQGGILTLYAAAGDIRVKSAVCHNAVLLKDEAEKFLKRSALSRALGKAMDVVAGSFPQLRVPTRTYINWKKVVEDERLLKKIYADPLFVKKYTLRALASLNNAGLPRPLEEVRTPIMILTGEYDEVVPPALGKRVFDRLGSPRKEFAVIPEAAHMLLLEYIPQSLPVVARWFRETL